MGVYLTPGSWVKVRVEQMLCLTLLQQDLGHMLEFGSTECEDILLGACSGRSDHPGPRGSTDVVQAVVIEANAIVASRSSVDTHGKMQGSELSRGSRASEMHWSPGSQSMYMGFPTELLRRPDWVLLPLSRYCVIALSRKQDYNRSRHLYRLLPNEQMMAEKLDMAMQIWSR